MTQPMSPYQTPPTAPKRSHKVRNTLLTVGGVIVVLGALGSIGGKDKPTPAATTPQVTIAPAAATAPTGSSKPTGKPSPKANASKPAAVRAPSGLNTPVRDGKFEFTVTGMKQAVRVGNSSFGQAAQGEFVLVSVRVKNIGDAAQMFDGSNQKWKDAAGREYSADGGAAMYLGGANSFLKDINPGNTVAGVVIFDVPHGTKLTTMTLHDSIWSGGVDLPLTVAVK